MTDQDRQISAIFAEQKLRLRNFIRRRVPDPRDAEDILQDLFGGWGGGSGGGKGRMRHRMRERWEKMTPEERERFRQGVGDC